MRKWISIYQRNAYRKNLSCYISAMSQGFKRGRKWKTNSPMYIFLQFIWHIQLEAWNTSLVMAIVFQSRPYGRFTEIKSNLRRMKAPIFLKTVLAIETVTALRERQSQYLKRYFFLKKRPIHFHINSTRVIRPAKQNNSRFSSVEIDKPLDAPVCSVLQIRFKCRRLFSCCHKSDAWSQLE